MSPKKRKLSGIGRRELQAAYDSLLRLQRSLVYEEAEEEEGPAPASLEQQLDTARMLSCVGVKAGRASAFYLLQYDHGGLDRVENHVHWLYSPKAQFY